MKKYKNTPDWLINKDKIHNLMQSKDYEILLPLLEDLVSKGIKEAQHLLGWFLWTGKAKEHIGKDEARAIELMHMAAEQKDRGACLFLAIHYGKDEQKDIKKSVKYYITAAELGHVIAQNNLGVLFAVGDMLEQDLVKAYAWFSLASMGGHEASTNNLSSIKKKLSETKIKEAKEQVQEFINLGFLYEENKK